MHFFFFTVATIPLFTGEVFYILNCVVSNNNWQWLFKFYMFWFCTYVVSACCDYIKQTVNGYDFYFVRHNNKYYYNLDNSTIVITYRQVIPTVKRPKFGNGP